MCIKNCNAKKKQDTKYMYNVINWREHSLYTEIQKLWYICVLRIVMQKKE